MFPIPFNIPFRKKDGSLSTLGDELNNGGGGSSYTLPTASDNVKGGVKIGSGLTMDGETLNNSNPTPYTLPTASDNVKGGVKIGSGLSIDENGVLSASGGSGGSIPTVVITTHTTNLSADEPTKIALNALKPTNDAIPLNVIDSFAYINKLPASNNQYVNVHGLSYSIYGGSDSELYLYLYCKSAFTGMKYGIIWFCPTGYTPASNTEP